MGQIYRFLGLDTGLIQDGMSTSERRENYKADITYVTNYEVTFDFLRDNMALNLSDVVLRPLIIASLMKLTYFNRRGSNPINYFQYSNSNREIYRCSRNY
jgi:hypothetical protein